MDKVRLIRRVPVEPKHGMEKGKVFEVVRKVKAPRGYPKIFVIGEAGEEVGLKSHEYEFVDDEKDIDKLIDEDWSEDQDIFDTDIPRFPS